MSRRSRTSTIAVALVLSLDPALPAGAAKAPPKPSVKIPTCTNIAGWTTADGTWLGDPSAWNLGLNTATSTMYGIVQKYSSVTLWSMAVSSGDIAAPVSLGAVTGLPSGVRFIGGDVDSSTGTYYLISKSQLFAVDTSTRVATEVTSVPAGWKFGRDIVIFGGSVWSVLPNKVESFNLTTSATKYAILAKNIRGNAPTVVTNGDGNTIAWINAKSGNVYQATHLTDGGTITVSAVGSGPVTPPLKVGDGAGGCLA